MTPILHDKTTRYNRADWQTWAEYLATVPGDRSQRERDRWIAAFRSAADVLPDTAPMWDYHPHDWTPADILLHAGAYCRRNGIKFAA